MLRINLNIFRLSDVPLIKPLLLALASIGVSTLPAIADELNDRFVAACVADGDSPALCSCTANAMQSTFSDADFAQIVSILEIGDSEAGSQLLDSIFVSQPQLVAVFSAAMSACH